MADGKHSLFAIAARGVNVVDAPTHLMEEEVTKAQNAEGVSDQGEGALDKRPGMSRINGSALGGSVALVHDLVADILIGRTPYLYAGYYTGSTHTWRRSIDGTTWADVDSPAAAGSNNASITGYWKRFPTCVSLGAKMYYCDGDTPIGIHEWDGTTDRILSTVPPAVAGSVLAPPGGANVASEYETGGATSYSYKLVARNGASTSAASNASTVTNNAALGTVDFNAIEPSSIPAGATSFDVYRTAGGATQGKIGSIPIVGGAATKGNGSGLSGYTWTKPTLPNIVAVNNPPVGATAYSYAIVARYGSAHSIGGFVRTYTYTLTGTALDNANYLRITPVNFAGGDLGVLFDVYRTSGGLTQGKIGTIDYRTGIYSLNDTGLVADGASLPVANVGVSPCNSLGVASNWAFTDGGLAGDSAAAPVAASGASVGDAIGVLTIVTDGTNIYLAVIDGVGTDPNPVGRILSFNPTFSNWLQIGAAFPIAANGNGTPGALAMFDGGLTYGTFTGITSGNTSYLASLNTPLVAGGFTLNTTATSFSITAALPFNGTYYAATASLVAATGAIILKRSPSAFTWSTARTGPATAQFNAWTTLAVSNGMLFAGWTSGGGATAARIESTYDGITWTLEFTADVAEVPCQMVTFNGALYVVLGKTGIAYNTKSRIVKRSAGGVWSQVDDPSDDFAGCLGVVYL